MNSTTTHTSEELNDIINWFHNSCGAVRVSWLPRVKSKTECVYTVKWHCDGDRLQYWMHSASTVSE